jgi:Tol biopolymer transport system component
VSSRPGTAASSSKPVGKIVFTVFVNSRGDLYTTDVDGLQRRQLTNDRAVEEYPVWSSNGRSIAYEKGRLYEMPATGGRPRRLLARSSLTVAISGISDLSWSARGRFAFTATKKFLTPFEVWTYSPKGTLRRLTKYGLHPSWSPAGTRVAYAGQSGIFIIRADGRGNGLVPGTSRRDSAPIWSPDGRWIAVSNTHTNTQKEQVFSIDILSPTGRQRTRIVTARFLYPAAWSPASDAILFQRAWALLPRRPACASSSSSEFEVVGRRGRCRALTASPDLRPGTVEPRDVSLRRQRPLQVVTAGVRFGP